MTGIEEYPLNTIYFYLTPECNLACRHCWIAPRFRNATTATEYLPLPLFHSIIEQAIPLGLTGIKLTGGEPLLHPGVMEILESARQYDLGVTVETNGTLITPEFADSLKRCTNPFISVSLDGFDRATHEWVRGVEGSYEATLEGIRTLVAAGLRPQVIMSIFRRNVGQIAELVTMVEEMGAGSVKFNIIEPSSRGSSVHERGEALPIGNVISTGEWVVNALSKEHAIPLYFSIPAAFRPMGALFCEGGSGCDRCGIRGIIGVLGDGSYALCGIGATVPEMVFGHAATDRLEEIWLHHPVVTDIREGLPRRLKGVCRNCAMRGVCQGSCLAQNFAQSGDLWSPFWFCSRAEEEGLFPKARLIPRTE